MRSEVEHQNDALSQKQVAIEAKLRLNWRVSGWTILNEPKFSLPKSYRWF